MKHIFKNLKIWQEGMELLSAIYHLTSTFPSEEKFGLISQMRRSALSVPSNIAEGSSRSSNKDFKRYLEIAIGSLFELQTQLIFSQTQNYIAEQEFETINNQIINLQKMTSGFRNKI